MKPLFKLFYSFSVKVVHAPYYFIYRAFRKYTMIPPSLYINNLKLVNQHRNLDGCVVECGTWRGGMIGGIARLLGPNREYYLFDSFEGLPAAKEIDGSSAIAWQKDVTSPTYLDNCTADISYARKAMNLSGAKKYTLAKGWFSETLPKFDRTKKIAVLRLDGDWYDSTMDCLNNLYDSVVPGGIIIIDDYHAWDGCSRAIHDFLSARKLADRIHEWENSVCYLQKCA